MVSVSCRKLKDFLCSLPHPFAGLNVRTCVREGSTDPERGRHSLCKSETRAPGILSGDL